MGWRYGSEQGGGINRIALAESPGILSQFKEIGILIDQNPPVSPLKEMPHAAIPTIEVSRITAVDPMHHLQQVPLGSLKCEMIVIAHENKTVNHQLEAVVVIFQESKESFPVRILQEDILLLVSSAGHVVQCARILYP